MAAPKTKRRAAVLFVAATLLAPAYAASASPECDEIGNLGRFIMEKRQADTLKDEVRNTIYTKSYREQAFGIVLLDEAYKIDVMSNYGTRKNAIDDFTATAIQGCEAIITH
ncbi:hypothetical protein ACGYLO_11670 [Sulfitobacter sp. 1A13353]|uniref:hypothetical protein n=1 Tax=Sulfitobacter sp. 1A13353 TaxID=3368568 RepID=UPI003746061B